MVARLLQQLDWIDTRICFNSAFKKKLSIITILMALESIRVRQPAGKKCWDDLSSHLQTVKNKNFPVLEKNKIVYCIKIAG
jgi:hypothetical protein